VTDLQCAVLAFEARTVWWRYAGAKEDAVLAELGLSPTRYTQVLVQVLGEPEAAAAEPLVVRRLQRLADARRAGRAARAPGAGRG
jgi:hypothetical protein